MVAVLIDKTIRKKKTTLVCSFPECFITLSKIIENWFQVFDITLRGPKRDKLPEYGVALQNLVAAITGTKR